MTTSRSPDEIARDVVDAVVQEQISRSDSLTEVAGVLAGLAGVITELAARDSTVTNLITGRVGLGGAAFAAIFAVVALITKRPGRQPTDLADLVKQIRSADAEVSELALAVLDESAAASNEVRLKAKIWTTNIAGAFLALSVAALATATMFPRFWKGG